MPGRERQPGIAPTGALPDAGGLTERFVDHATSLGLWLWDWDLETGQLSFTPGWEALLGYGAGELTFDRVADLFDRLCHPDDRDEVATELRACLVGSKDHFSSEHRLRSKSGEWRWFSDRGRVVDRTAEGRVRRMLGMRTDITDRKRAELALADADAHHRLFARSNSAAFWTRSADGVLSFLDEAVAASFGLPQHLVGLEARRNPVHPEDRARMTIAWQRAESSGEPFDCEHRMRMADGRYLWIHARAYPVRDASGRIEKWLGSSNIIHDRKTAELERQDREDHLHSVLDTVPDAIIIMDESGVVRSFSAGAERMFGYSAGEVVGGRLDRLMPSSLVRAHEQGLARYLKTGAARVVGQQRTLQAMRKSGSVFPVEVFVGEARLAGARVFSGFVRDMSERRAIEGRLRQLQDELAFAQRTNAMVAMGSAIAHELNQPLAASLNYLSAVRAARARENASIDIDAALTAAANQIVRAGEVLRHLRRFISREKLRPARESLRDIVGDAIALALVGHRNIAIASRIAPAAEWVMVERVGVQQVLFNLVRNAAEALVNTEMPSISITARLQGEEVEVELRDNGPGLPPQRRKRLFEPLKSSKKGGMGVGLAICREIVSAHGGRIWAEPAPGGGTAFKLTLPVAAKQAI